MDKNRFKGNKRKTIRLPARLRPIGDYAPEGRAYRPEGITCPQRSRLRGGRVSVDLPDIWQAGQRLSR